MKKALALMVLVLLMVLSLAGCARVESHFDSYVDAAKKKGVSDDYLKSLSQWTRSQTAYSEFATMVTITATYKSKPFRDAYLKEYSRLYMVPGPEREKKTQVIDELSSEETEFNFYAYTPERDYSNDFAKANSTWKVFLEDEKGNRTYPLEIKQITKITPLIEGFYPYLNQFYGRFYSLRFPPQKDMSRQKLIFTSILASVELNWQ